MSQGSDWLATEVLGSEMVSNLDFCLLALCPWIGYFIFIDLHFL